ncbi:fibronectin type III domain-containing protein [Trichloromonas sp.]|uniref:fibronectin type III domain-containing protein n=1 Tax=Trichloromonas sp. TaxID=3069249 RepID=UPI003D812875
MKPAATIYRLLPLLACLLLALGGCGKKGPVKPLAQPLPAAPEKLAALQQGNLMQLDWEIPVSNQDGSPLTNLQGFNILKMRYDIADDCPECRDSSTLLRQIDLEFLKNAERKGNRLTFWDNDLEPGYGYQYKVVAYTRRNRDGAPATIRRPFLTPAAAPAGLQASAHDRMVRLEWQPAAAPADGELLGYNLYRRSSGEILSSLPVNDALLTVTSFEDFGLQNGIRYSYTLRTVLHRGNTRLESTASSAVVATPKAGQ